MHGCSATVVGIRTSFVNEQSICGKEEARNENHLAWRSHLFDWFGFHRIIRDYTRKFDQ